MRERLARLISNTLNPFVISVIIIVLLGFKETSSITDAIKWASVSLAMSVLPVFIIVIFLVYSKKMDGFFTTTREQRNIVYLLASALGTIGCGLLWYLKAPELLKITFTTGLIAIIVFMVINYKWKISLHTAFMSASITVIIIVYGTCSIWTILVLPLIAWARIELKQHSIKQVAAGGLIAAIMVVGVFWGFGIIGS